jgi:hypothetical protein
MLHCKVKFKKMQEIIIRTNNPLALQKLKDFLLLFDFEVIYKNELENREIEAKNLPVTWAKEPDFMSLAGIWKNKPPITQEELREKAWGNRL